jgi:hypothetical protein
LHPDFSILANELHIFPLKTLSWRILEGTYT